MNSGLLLRQTGGDFLGRKLGCLEKQKIAFHLEQQPEADTK